MCDDTDSVVSYRKVIHDGHGHVFHEGDLSRTKTICSGFVVQDTENSDVVAAWRNDGHASVEAT